MMIQFPVLLPNQDQMKLAESLDLDLTVEREDSILMVESAFIISIWKEGRNTGIGIDGPPYQAIVKLPYEQVKIALASAKIEVIE